MTDGTEERQRVVVQRLAFQLQLVDAAFAELVEIRIDEDAEFRHRVDRRPRRLD